MHWIQDEKPIEYHVVKWDNSAFHNHDKVHKRKLLGGVSFDGGGAGGGGTGSAAQGTGVISLQSSFPVGHGIGLGNGAGLLNESGKAGSSLEGTGNTGKDTVSIHSMQEGNPPKEAEAIATLQAPAHTDMNTVADTVKPEHEKRKNSFDYQKYIKKMRSGIKSFLQSMRQKSGKEQKRQDVKKEIKGTRPVTKEDVYEVQINTAYLLDSYNKYGERSTLGKE